MTQDFEYRDPATWTPATWPLAAWTGGALVRFVRAGNLARFAGVSGGGDSRGKNNWMTGKSLFRQTLAASLLLLSGCDVAHSARDDLNRLISSDPFKSTPQRRPTRPAQPAAKPAPASQAAATSAPAAPEASDTEAKPEPSRDSSGGQPPITIIGKSESEILALFGPPTTVEERAPGKTWRYRDGKCALDVQLYPDVQTRQFATLAYEVKSDDITDEGNGACLGQLRSRAQSR
ncbi:MAG: hypothetical protein JSR90_23755 [Proteobacteria bacterium]|nr:hypothetical protein [Pseudomonadota bacterium]